MRSVAIKSRPAMVLPVRPGGTFPREPTSPKLEDASMVFDNVFVGNVSSAKNKDFIRANNIKLVISLYGDVSPTPDVRILPFSIADTIDADEKMRAVVDEALPAMKDVITAGGNVLVHCHAGISRSATVATAYYLTHVDRKIPPFDALRRLTTRRPIMNPNLGFLYFLTSIPRDEG